MNVKIVQQKTDVKIRIKKFLKANKIKQINFAKLVGIDDSLLRRKEFDFSLNTIIKILTAYGEINPDWLLLGKGEMLRGVPTDVEQLEISKNRIIQQKDDIIAQLNLIVGAQVEVIESQREIIKNREG